MPRNDLVLRAARRERTERTPVWLMRQAGRCDPEYRRFRERNAQPLEVLFSTPELATEASLLPRRLGVDAIIFYQDILTLLGPLGAPFAFRPEPVTQHAVRSSADVARLRRYDVAQRLPFVGQTLRQVKAALADQMPLLGFAGAPLTLLFFLAAGRSPTQGAAAPQAFLRDEPTAAHRLLETLADQTADYLAYQIESGADAVQLFESCADLLDAPQYREFALPYQVRVFEQLGRRVPRILFAKEQPDVALLVESGADVLSVGRCVDLAAARRQWGERVAFQGNVDNELLVRGTSAEVVAATRACIAAGQHHGHILNLSHGLLRETPIENVCALINACRQTILTEPRAAG